MRDHVLEKRARLPYVAFPMTLTTAELAHHIPEGYRRLDGYLGEIGLEERGPSIIRYTRGSEAGPWDIEVGWVMEVANDVPKPFVAGELPAGRYVVGWHDGPYTRIAATTVATMAWGEANGVKFDVVADRAGDRWACWYELYLTEPMFGPEGPTGAVEVCLLTRA
jgi:AraC family transcriptional regulator